MQYIPTDLPQYWKIHPRSDFSDALIQEDHVLIFSQDGQSLTVKKPDGTFEVLSGSNSFAGLQVGVLVDDNGTLKVQPLSFNGTEASDSGSLQEYDLKIFNTGKDEPDYGGSVVPGSSADYYRCVYSGSDSWGGYKAVLQDDIYVFQHDLVQGLEYKVKPDPGSVYTEDGKVKAILYQAIPTGNLVFYHSFKQSASYSDIGNKALTTSYGTVSYTVEDGIPCAWFGDAGMNCGPLTDIVSGYPAALSFWVKMGTQQSVDCDIWSLGGTYADAGKGLKIGVSMPSGRSITDSPIFISSAGTYAEVSDQSFDLTKWHNIILNYDGTNMLAYMDGVECMNFVPEWTFGISYGGYFGRLDNRYNAVYAYISSARVYTKTLTAAEIFSLSHEF